VETIFDIFRGTNDRDAAWIEVVEGLSGARQRMEEIAAAKPGQYFVFDPQRHSVVARIDTRKVAPWPERKVTVRIA
jgi:hypothetical protein